MMPATLAVLRAALAADPTVGVQERGALLAALRGGVKTAGQEENRLMRRAEAARVLSCHPRTIDNLAAAGTLRRVMFPGRKLGAGFRASDVLALLDGRTEAA